MEMGRLRWIHILVVIYVQGTCYSDVVPPSECTADGQYLRSADCKSFWHCSPSTHAYERCADELVFSLKVLNCVRITDSQWNDCEVNLDVDVDIEEECNNGADILPHPDECQLFYNCSQTNLYSIGKYYDECPYPKLFSMDSYKCEDFEMVTCGSRTETKSVCSYWKSNCRRAHCPGCIEPSCENKADGLRDHQYRENSQYYVICYKERLIGKGECDNDKDGRQMIFSKTEQKCVSVDDLK